MKQKIFALIGARGGSKGIPNKNIVNLGGIPLIAYSVLIAKLSKYITHTIVSSDSKEILNIAKKYDKDIITLNRTKELASDTATDLDWILDVCHKLMHKNMLPNLFVHLRPTTPSRRPGIIDGAIATMLQCPDVTSLRSAHKLEESPYKMFVKDEDRWKPFMQMDKKEFYNLPRQAFPQVYHPNGYVDILRVNHILEKNNLHGENMLAFETEKVVEIDTPENLKEAESQCASNFIWVHKYLKDIPELNQ